MKRFIPLAVVLGVLNVASADLYLETFDTGTAGWFVTTINSHGGEKYTEVDWIETGENPDGYIYAGVPDLHPIDDDLSYRLYALQAPDVSVYGDLTEAGLLLTTDFMVGGTFTVKGDLITESVPTVRFYIGAGGDYYVSNDDYSWNPNEDTEWTTHQVPLTVDGFIPWPNPEAVGMTFDQILSAPEDIGLVFTGVSVLFDELWALGFSGTEGVTMYINNFGVVPLPGAVVLGLLGLGVAGWRLRHFSHAPDRKNAI